MRLNCHLVVVFLLALGTRLGAAEPAGASLNFETHVRPILKAHCFHCHGEEPKPKGKLDLRIVRAMRRGGVSGGAITPGHRDESLIWERLESGDMPPGPKKLSDAEKATIGAWIDAGAKVTGPEPKSLPPGPVLTAEERGFWSFQPVKRPEVPKVKNAAAVRTPVDAFLLAKLEAKGLGYSKVAERHALIRRATFDLTGLPPTIDEIDAFLKDTSADAYERLIDRLLVSPRYGERWARHWLDVVGYADSDGNPSGDAIRPHAYRYRDYVIRSLNNDRPWNILIQEQMAGDEMIASSYDNLDTADHDKLAATGFLRMAPDSSSEGGAEVVQARNDVVAETIKVVSSSLLGLTVGCAQCHSHRYDPITHDDYYRFRAVFEPAFDVANWRNSPQRLISLWSPDERRQSTEVDAAVNALNVERGKKIEELVKRVLERELGQIAEPERTKARQARDTPDAKRTSEQNQLLKTYPRVLVSAGNVSLYDASSHNAIMAEFDKKIAAANAKRPAEAFFHALNEQPGRVPKTFLFTRGDPKQPAHEVQPDELMVLSAAGKLSIAAPSAQSSGRRLAYARHLTSGKHPLVARVLVNRIWLNHFGKGLVATPGDFGMLGERPSHPELLDWQADEFMHNGWRLKHIHRLIMTSNAYRQSSARTTALDAVDPDNRLIGRMSVRRLESEAVRDAMLACSGALNLNMYGPPLPVAPDEAGQVLIGKDTRDSAGRQNGTPGSLGAEEFRRSIYVQVRRSLPLSFTESFDVPTLDPNCTKRAVSTVSPQSLALMNNEFAVAQSEVFADRVIKQAGADKAARVKLAWRIAFGSEPAAAQVNAAVAFMNEQKTEFASKATAEKLAKAPDPERQALASFCQALMGSNAFLYID